MVQNRSNPQADYFIKPSAIKSTVGISRSTALRLEAEGDFPKRRRVSPGQTAWLASEVFDWARQREIN